MKKLPFTLLMVLLAWTGLRAQPQLRKTSLSPMGGTTLESASIRMIDAGGEVFNAETDAASLHLSEGFIGPDVAQMLGVGDYQVLTGVRVFPNPVRTDLHVQLPSGDGFEIYMHDGTGHEIFHTLSEAQRVTVPMLNFRVGIYLLTVIDRQNKRVVTYKIQKIL